MPKEPETIAPDFLKDMRNVFSAAGLVTVFEKSLKYE